VIADYGEKNLQFRRNLNCRQGKSTFLYQNARCQNPKCHCYVE